METKRNKIIYNMKSHWISMLSPMKQVLYEHRSLLMKIALDLIVVPLDASNLDLLCDMEILWFVLFQCWKLHIPWWSLHKFTMYLFVTLWQQWSFVKLISTRYMWVLLWLLMMMFFRDFMGWWKPTMMTYVSNGSQI